MYFVRTVEITLQGENPVLQNINKEYAVFDLKLNENIMLKQIFRYSMC